MPKNEWPTPSTVFQANLQRLIGEDSVNAWAGHYKLEQTGINRLVRGQDPRLSTLQEIAAALRVPVWLLLIENLTAEQVRNPPVVRGAAGNTEVELYKRLDELSNLVTQLREEAVRGTSVFGDNLGDEKTG